MSDKNLYISWSRLQYEFSELNIDNTIIIPWMGAKSAQTCIFLYPPLISFLGRITFLFVCFSSYFSYSFLSIRHFPLPGPCRDRQPSPLPVPSILRHWAGRHVINFQQRTQKPRTITCVTNMNFSSILDMLEFSHNFELPPSSCLFCVGVCMIQYSNNLKSNILIPQTFDCIVVLNVSSWC